MDETFERNLNVLEGRNPSLASALKTVGELRKYEVFRQGERAVEINIYDHDRKLFIYNDPLEDLSAQLEGAQRQKNYKYLYLFGIGNGFFLQSLLLNDRAVRICVVEPETELLYIGLHLHDFSEALRSGRLQLFSSAELTFERVCDIVAESEALLHSKYLSFIRSAYYSLYANAFERIKKLFSEAVRYAVSLQGTNIDDSIKGLEQFVQHADILCRSTPLCKLENIRKGGKAIIVSTGPSLAKQLPLLKKAAPHAMLISVDASLPILAKHGIKPDIVVSMERDEPTSKFFLKTPVDFQEGILFICASLQHQSVFDAIKAGTLMCVLRTLPEYRFFELDRYGYIGAGFSAANMAHELAHLIGVDEAIFIGQDLAFAPDGSTHAPGHVFASNVLIEKEKEKNGLIEIAAYGGHGSVKTHIYWILFKQGLEHSIAAYRHGMRSVNATEGGARIEGTEEMRFSDVCGALVREKEKELLVVAPPTAEDIRICRKTFNARIRKLLKEAKKVVPKIERMCQKIAAFDPAAGRDETVSLYNEIGRLRNAIRANEAFSGFFILLLRPAVFENERETCALQARYYENDTERLRDVIMANGPFWKKLLSYSRQVIGILEKA